MNESEARPRVSRGEEALYGEMAILVRQVSLAYVALTDARQTCAEWLQKHREEDVELSSGTCEICSRQRDDLGARGWHDEGTPMLTCEECGGGEVVADASWEEAFTIIANAEPALEQALFTLGDHALSTRRSRREGVDSLPVFGTWNTTTHSFGGGSVRPVPGFSGD